MTGLLRPSRTEQSWLTTASLLVLAGVAGAFALAYTRPVMVPFVLAVFISYLVSPLVDLLHVRFKVPRVASVLMALLVASALLTLLGLLITTSTRGIIENVDVYRERLISIAARAFAVLDRFNLDLGQASWIQTIEQIPLARIVRSTAGTVVGFVTNGFLVLIFVIYMLIGRHPSQLRTGLYAEIDAKIRTYLGMKFIISAGTGITVGIILAILGLDLALVFGVLAFLLNFIPSIGSIVATLLPLPIALIQFDSMVMVALVVLLPGAVQITVGNFVEPLVVGEGLDLHPITILMALIFWGLLWGVVGMLLATPITAVIKIVFARLEMTRPVSELLAGRLPRELPVHTVETAVPPTGSS